MDAQPPSTLAPVAAYERLANLDVLRGFALFGILIVNILDFEPEAVSTLDRAVRRAVSVLAEGSFFPLFSLLFGVGFAVFLDRADAAGRNALPFFLRRVVGLFAIGVAQFLFLEERDILLRYSFLALPLLLFWKASSRTCLIAAVLFLVLASGRGAMQRAATQSEASDAARAQSITTAQAEQQDRLAKYQQVSASGSYLGFVAFRARWTLRNSLNWSANFHRNHSLLVVLSMFTLGVALWRAGVFTNPNSHRHLLRATLVVGGFIGIAANLPRSYSANAWSNFCLLVAARILPLAYASAVTLLWASADPGWRRVLSPLATIGRMGLTNYLWQSVAMSALFLPYGANLEGKVPVWGLPLIALGIYIPCWPMSRWWLTRFRFGPVEWLWRCVTYAELQPFRISAPTNAIERRPQRI